MRRSRTGRLTVKGNVTLASSCRIECAPTDSHCIASHGGTISIGERTRIGSGAAISAREEVTIGEGVSIGMNVVIQDFDFHVVGEGGTAPVPRPVHIGDHVVIGHSVTILPGTRLGAGAEIRSGAVVGGDIAPGTSAAGNPARSLQASTSGPQSPAQILATMLSLAAPPPANQVFAELPGLDSLMLLRFLIEMEEHHGIWLDQHSMDTIDTVGDLNALVSASN